MHYVAKQKDGTNYTEEEYEDKNLYVSIILDFSVWNSLLDPAIAVMDLDQLTYDTLTIERDII